MKRYWSSIVVVLLTAAGLATYAFAGATDHLPEYKLETLQGDPEAASGLNLSGSYGGRQYSEYIEVTTEGTRYDSQHDNFREAFFGMRNRGWFYAQEDVAELVSKYKGFMRGKTHTAGLYADDQTVLYADIAYDRDSEAGLRFDIELLDRATGKESSIALSTAFPDAYTYAFLQDVRKIGDELHMLIRHSTSQDDEGWYDDVIDLKSGKLLSSRQLVTGQGTEEEIQYTMNPEAISDQGEYVVLAASTPEQDRSDTVYEEQDAGTVEQEPVMNYYLYSYRTGEISGLNQAFMQTPDSKNDSIILKDDQLWKAVWDEQSLELSRYDINTGLTHEAYVKTSAKELGGASIRNVLLLHNKVYISLDNERPTAAVLDGESGKLLYLGEVVYQGPASQEADEMEQLSLLNIGVN